MGRILVPTQMPYRIARDESEVRADMRATYRKLRSFVVWGHPWGKREPIDVIRNRRFQTANLEGTGPADYWDEQHGWFADKSSTSVNNTNWVDNDTLIIPNQDGPVAWGMKYVTDTTGTNPADLLWARGGAVGSSYQFWRDSTFCYARQSSGLNYS